MSPQTPILQCNKVYISRLHVQFSVFYQKGFSEEAHEVFLRLPGLLIYLPIGKGSEIEVKTDSAGEKKSNPHPKKMLCKSSVVSRSPVY